jgi:hypothetical protein
LLRDGGLQVPVVVVISWEVLQVGFELLVFCETGLVVTVIRRNRDEVLAQPRAEPGRRPGAGDRDEAGGVLRRAGVEKRLSWTTPSALDSP